MNSKKLHIALAIIVFTICTGNIVSAQKPQTIDGWVVDSACAYTKNLSKPISPACAAACAKNGSPLVILTNDGSVLLPIDNATPAKGQNERLMKFAGRKVKVTGQLFERGGGKAVQIHSIQLAEAKE